MKIIKFSKLTQQDLERIIEINSKSAIEKELTENDLFFGAIINDKLIGYIQVMLSQAHITALYVHRDYIRSKQYRVGESLLKKTIELLTSSGANQIQAGVESTNKKAIPFYKKYGFHESGVGTTGFTSLVYNVSK